MRGICVKNVFKVKGRKVYIFFMLIGISMIFCGFNNKFLVPHKVALENGKYQFVLIKALDSELSSLIMNLGIGIFPTGIVGWMFEIVNEKNQKKEISDKRAAILKKMYVLFHRYLTEVCYQYQLFIKEKNNYYLPKFNILDSFGEMSSNYTLALNWIHKGQIKWTEKEVEEFFRNEIATIGGIEEVLNAIIFNRDVYIINNIFSEEEVTWFDDLEENITKFNIYIKNKNYIKGAQERHIIMEIIYNIITYIPELSIRFKGREYENGGIK